MIFKRRRRRRQEDCLLLAAVAVQLSTAAAAANEDDDAEPVGYLPVQAFCRRNYVQVKAVWLTCDTPGAYYQGGSAYRNSLVCTTGDTANLDVEFVVPSSIQGTLGLRIESGLYDVFVSVRNSSSLCQDYYLSAVGDGYECPEAGRYLLSTAFSVPSITSDYAFHYTPDIKLTFVVTDNDDDSSVKRVGCATTGTVAMHQHANHKATSGWIALGVAILAFLAVFALLLYLSYRRKKRLQHQTEEKQQQNNQSYHYFKTLPNGQVVPLGERTGGGTGAPRREATTNALDISNPSYNEPQVPTRPII